MSDRGRLGQDILEYMHFCKGIGVRWVRKLSSSAGSLHVAAPGSSGPVVPAAAARAEPFLARAFPQSESMFDKLEIVEETLEKIRQDLGDCQRCKLAAGRLNIVFGTGNPDAELMFVGEAPGADEDEQGLPFVGRAGQLLTRIIESIGMRREDVYICNILKCRPPGNRNPESDEIASCEPFLLRQIASVKPKVICALGTFGAQTLLRTKEPISRLRGHLIDFRGAKLMATFHPAYLLRNPNERRKVWEDVQKVRDYLQSLRPAR